MADPRWAALGAQSFVSLTTFRRNGDPVSTAVWIARVGDELLVTTFVQTGKVKRIRHDARVELLPCDRRGRVFAGDPVPGRARVLTDDDARARMSTAFRRKYPLSSRLAFLVTRMSRKARERRAVLSIYPA